jgi:hypothetical protein
MRLRRRSERHHCYRAAKIKLRAGARAHDCLLIDIVDGGVRLVRLQMVWDNLSCLGTEALARLGLEFRRLSTDVAIVAV